MNCPRCFGVGFIKGYEGVDFDSDDIVDIWYLCSYEGCHNGVVHCCAGENVDLALERKKE